MLARLQLADIGGGINLIDVGASGRLDRRWNPIRQHINLLGFEPNEAECRRLQGKPHHFCTATYLPYAIGGSNERASLYRTRSIYCCSVLRPNLDWLRRFSFSNLFELEGTEDVQLRRLCDIPEVAGLDVDVIKVDSQGLELPILSAADEAVARAFMVETETGFVENYHGETTYAQIDEFMRNRGFLLFDINVRHRIARSNVFERNSTGKEQILWCEAVWLKDYVACQKNGVFGDIGRGKAMKALLLCALQGCIDFGYELAKFFHRRSLISSAELDRLGNKRAWDLSGPSMAALPLRAFGLSLRFLPRSMRSRIATEVERNLTPHSPLKTMVQRLRGRRAA